MYQGAFSDIQNHKHSFNHGHTPHRSLRSRVKGGEVAREAMAVGVQGKGAVETVRDPVLRAGSGTCVGAAVVEIDDEVSLPVLVA